VMDVPLTTIMMSMKIYNLDGIEFCDDQMMMMMVTVSHIKHLSIIFFCQCWKMNQTKLIAEVANGSSIW